MSSKSDRLKIYKEKRDFELTPEPEHGGKPGRYSRFVVQQHAARALHFDFRLEVDGVLKSWAVPKGPSTDPHDKRLAMPTEDHPLSYIDFEGVIPAGQYGAGEVIVWDLGYYLNITENKGDEVSMQKALEQGHVVVWLEGQKLSGGYALIRAGGEDRERWLLIKKDDEMAGVGNPVVDNPRSIISGKTIEEMGQKEFG